MTDKRYTVADYSEGRLEGKTVHIDTFAGRELVTGLRQFADGPWVVCGKANGGFGISYCVCLDRELVVS